MCHNPSRTTQLQVLIVCVCPLNLGVWVDFLLPVCFSFGRTEISGSVPRTASMSYNNRFIQDTVTELVCVGGRTLRVFSTSPQGSLFTKSIPVRGVPVGGSSIEASIIRYSTFSGLLCNIETTLCMRTPRPNSRKRNVLAESGWCFILNREGRKANIKRRLTHRHAPVFVLKHVQKDFFALCWQWHWKDV